MPYLPLSNKENFTLRNLNDQYAIGPLIWKYGCIKCISEICARAHANVYGDHKIKFYQISLVYSCIEPSHRAYKLLFPTQHAIFHRIQDSDNDAYPYTRVHVRGWSLSLCHRRHARALFLIRWTGITSHTMKNSVLRWKYKMLGSLG